jgi:C-terminal processing protease CtpA/Prc
MSAILGPYKKQSSRLSSPVFVGRSVQSAHLINAGDAIFAYVVIPACGAKRTNVQENAVDFRAYADSLHSIAAGLEASHPWGWIVDLRGNRGGNMYPMIAGIGFVLGEGPLGYFVSSNGVEDDWFYRQGSAGTMVGSRESTMAQVRDAPLSISDLPPVAVLLDSGTANAGEAVAITFIGRPRTRYVGSHTFGLSTGNKGFPLSDGALLVLCEVTEADRNQRRYPDGIEPDVVLPELATLPSEEADPVIQAAKQWLFSLRTQ